MIVLITEQVMHRFFTKYYLLRVQLFRCKFEWNKIANLLDISFTILATDWWSYRFPWFGPDGEFNSL
jgi:hypothetical protein